VIDCRCLLPASCCSHFCFDSLYLLATYLDDAAAAAMPQAAGGKKKGTKKQAPARAPPKKKKAAEEEEKKVDVDDDDDVNYGAATGDADVDEVADAMRKSLSLKTYFHRCRRQGYPIIIWAWTSGTTGITYITVRVQLLGTTLRKDLECEMLEEGRKLRIRVNFPEGGEDTNLEHLIVLNRGSDQGFTPQHPQYAILKAGQTALRNVAMDKKEEDHVETVLDLPFQCNPNGFVNPLKSAAQHQNKVHVGVFPLNAQKYPPQAGFPVPSAKFMHVTLEELHKPRVPQEILEEESFFPTAAGAPRGGGGSGGGGS